MINLSNKVTQPNFSTKQQELVDSFEGAEIFGKPKGASRTARIISKILCLICEEYQDNNPSDLIQQLKNVSKYFNATRGQMTPIIPNAIRRIMLNIDQNMHSTESIKNLIIKQSKLYEEESIQNIELITNHGTTILNDEKQVLLYDYSSTTASIIKGAAKQSKQLKIIIPESRALNGGIPLVKESISSNHEVLYITDAAIAQQIAEASLVVIGAESISNMGGCWNTTGSLSVAILADYYKIPFYVATELIKFDTINPEGVLRSAPWREITAIKKNDPILNDKQVEVKAHDLDYIKGKLITAYITEKGILSPTKTVSAARIKYSTLKNIN